MRASFHANVGLVLFIVKIIVNENDIFQQLIKWSAENVISSLMHVAYL